MSYKGEGGMLEEALTHSVIGATQQLFSYLCSTKLEVGLLLHFGREAKFQRVICENRCKRHHSPS